MKKFCLPNNINESTDDGENKLYAGQRKVYNDIQRKIKREQGISQATKDKKETKSRIAYFQKLISKNRQNKLSEDASSELEKIVDLPIDDFVTKFKDIATDSKVQAIIKAGLKDGKVDDEKITFTYRDIPVKDLLPTQNIIGQQESLSSILNDKYHSLKTFLSGNAQFPTPVITLNGKYIIDGHHRWSQVYIANPNATIPCYDMKANIEPLDALKMVQIAIAADTGGLPLSTAKGINILNADKADIEKVINSELTADTIKTYKSFKKGSNAKEISDYLWKNIEFLQKNNKPIDGAPDRNKMPQAGDSTGYDKLLKKGIVNFIKPTIKDLSKVSESENSEYVEIKPNSKFTFKTVKSQGRYRAFYSDNIQIKLDGKVVGSIDDKPPYKVSFMVEKNGTTITDSNPKCSWKNITFKQESESLDKAKEWILSKTDYFLKTYRFHYID